MPTAVENLYTRRDNILSELAAIVLKKPSYALDGQSVDWVAYRKSLYEELDDIQELLGKIEPFEIQTVAV